MSIVVDLTLSIMLLSYVYDTYISMALIYSTPIMTLYGSWERMDEQRARPYRAASLRNLSKKAGRAVLDWRVMFARIPNPRDQETTPSFSTQSSQKHC